MSNKKCTRFWWGVAIIIVVFILLFPIYVTENHSMESSVSDGDVLIGCSMTGSIERGDVVVVVRKDDSKIKKVVKRVIGIGGDTLEIRDGCVLLNDRMLNEPYLYEQMESENMKFDVPNGYVFVMGDNRNISEDSRSYGCVKSSDIVSKVIYNLTKMSSLN